MGMMACISFRYKENVKEQSQNTKSEDKSNTNIKN